MRIGELSVIVGAQSDKGTSSSHASHCQPYCHTPHDTPCLGCAMFKVVFTLGYLFIKRCFSLVDCGGVGQAEFPAITTAGGQGLAEAR